MKIREIYAKLSKKGKIVAIKGVVLTILTHIYWWVYMNIVSRVISAFFNIFYLILAGLKGEVENAFKIRKHIKTTLSADPSKFLDFYYQYASFSGYEVDDYINVYGVIVKNPFKDWQNWFVTSVLRGFKGDCDDYTSITSQLAKWAKIPHKKYITTIMTYDKNKVKLEGVAHAIVKIDKHGNPELDNKILTWGSIYTVKKYESIYVKRFSKSKNSIVIYSRY